MRLPLSFRVVLLVLTLGLAVTAAPGGVTFSQSAKSVETYDYVEVTLNINARTQPIRSPTRRSADGSRRPAEAIAW